MLTDTQTASVLGARQRVADALVTTHELARSSCDPALLSLCERRIATLLGVEVADPETDGAAVDPELARVAIVFVEQWVIDVASITDDMVVDLKALLGSDDAVMDFLHSLLVVEQRLRLGLAWRQLGLTT